MGNNNKQRVFEAKEVPTILSADPQDSATSQEEESEVVDVRKEDDHKMVMIRPIQTVGRTKIGKEWYHFVAGKTAIVPAHVRTLLEQKGVI